MPHFIFDSNEDGTIARILKDGQPHDEAVRLEQAFSIVTTYFRLAASNVARMEGEAQRDARRSLGLQSFLMSLTGLEAFTNTYFHLRARELDSQTIISRIEQTHGSLSRKIEELVAMTGDGPLVDQDALIQRVFELAQLRNELVHPRWVPSALTIGGDVPVHIDGLVENRQAIFEDEVLCREALLWCLLVVARVGQARGNQDLSGFMFHWTANYGLTLEAVLQGLGLPT